jgi:glutamate synthase (NADPH) small chain
MNQTIEERIDFNYAARPMNASRQGLLPGRYRWWVMGITMAAFSLAFIAWLNESWLYMFESPIWLNRYTEYAIILAFGLWRIRSEQNPYTRKRLIILVAVVTGFWWLIPWLLPVFEPYVGYVWSQPVFPALHTPGTLTFFLTLFLVFLFGRRIICGFGCPCVGIRETVGFPFRHVTLRSDWAWRLRHSKWFFLIWYVGVMVSTQFPPNAWTATLVGMFGLVVGLTYFGSFFIIPITGNRFYCRYLCPYGATFGLLNHAGFYGIEMEQEKCVDCLRCEQACDMGIPVYRQGQAHGRVTGLEDCMGCARCVLSCPTDALEIRDIRNYLRPSLRQDASYLLKREQPVSMPREETEQRLPAQRLQDWQETEKPISAETIQALAVRCLDCGQPGCRSACPLGNQIPDWLASAARGDWQQAGDLVHATSPLPEVCGRICPQHLLCESACTRGRMEGAVNIGTVEWLAAERALESGWQPPAPASRNGYRVAVIGAGPAGLACAEQLNQAGVEVTVYERESRIGGLLQYGVPSFKLDKGLLSRRRDLLQQTGINFQLGTDIDRDKLGELLSDNHGIFLGLGAQKPHRVELPGQEHQDIDQALEWLAEINRGARPELEGRQVLVLGGGDTAMDCARSALRLGAAVTIAYRGPEECLRAAPKEIALAREEGVRFLFDYTPVRFEGDSQRVRTVFNTPLGSRNIDSNQVILAFGQRPCPPAWLAEFEIATEEDGRILVDDQGRSSNPRIWAGGDNTHGPDLAVTAMAAGKQAAQGILQSFRDSSGARRLQ